MKIYKLWLKEEAISFAPPIIDIKSPIYSNEIKGSKKKLITEPIEIIRYGADYEPFNGEVCNITDGIDYLFDDYAIEKLNHLLKGNVEFYDCINEEHDYKYVYVTNVLKKTLNYLKSDIEWFDRDEKRAMHVEKYVFNKRKVKKQHIFGIEELFGNVYVSEEFKRVCEENNITGPEFKLVWDSEKEI